MPRPLYNDAARKGNPPRHRDRRPNTGRPLHGPLPQPSAAWLLRDARPPRRGWRFRYRAGNEPDVRRTDRRMGCDGVAADGIAEQCAPDRAWARARHADG